MDEDNEDDVFDEGLLKEEELDEVYDMCSTFLSLINLLYNNFHKHNFIFFHFSIL